MKKHTVFVSHAHVDNALCDRYVAALRSRGLDVWYDRNNLQAGQALSGEIQRQIQQRSAFVVMVSEVSNNSFWVNLEVDAFRNLMAHDSSRVLLPVRIGDCEVPALMGGIKWVDALHISFEDGVNEIAQALGADEPAVPLPSAQAPTVQAQEPVPMPMPTSVPTLTPNQPAPVANIPPAPLPDISTPQAPASTAPIPASVDIPPTQPAGHWQVSPQAVPLITPTENVTPPEPSIQAGGVSLDSMRSPLRFAPYWARAAAFLLDGLIVLLASFVALFVVTFIVVIIFAANRTLTSSAESNAASTIVGVLSGVILLGGGAVYLAVCWARSGQTLGNRLMRIRVIREDSQLLTFWQGLLRALVGMLLIDTVTCYAGWLWPLWDKKKQALHDKVAHSIVVAAG